MKLSVDRALRMASTYAQKGQSRDAEAILRKILQHFPNHRDATAALQSISAKNDRVVPSIESDFLIKLYEKRDFAGVIARAQALRSRYMPTPILLTIEGASLAALEQFTAALAAYDQALALRPDFADAHNSRGVTLKQLGRLEEALAAYDLAILHAPRSANAHINRANALQKLGRSEDAIAAYDAAIELVPGSPDAHNYRAIALRDLGQFTDALASCDQALRLRPGYSEALNIRGLILKSMGKLEEALANYDDLVARAPQFADAYNNRANVLAQMKRLDEALSDYDTSLSLRPISGTCHSNRGNVLLDLDRTEEAIASYREAIRQQPDSSDAYVNLGNALSERRQLDQAIESYEAALRINRNHDSALGHLLHRKAQICDWSKLDLPVDMDRIGTWGRGISPFSMLGIDDSLQRHLKRSQVWVAGQLPAARPLLARSSSRSEKLRIGYFSADYHNHAMMYLAVRLFELHDQDRFETHAFSFGPASQDLMRQRAIAAFDEFHDVRSLSDAAIAELARDKGIDIAIDLSGYTRGNRAGIFAYRAAPIQINYMGFPGTMGADFIDYIIADQTIIPASSISSYSEKIIFLPDTYQVNDDRRAISDRQFTRHELQLPDNGFVFCCFNNTYKITPDAFDVWMRLLMEKPGSVLWLMESNSWVKTNLRKEASARNIDPDRIVFASPMPLPEHLARHRHADLFLDTFIYNAHTTGSDALWAGLPIVTKTGESFASRVCASLLNAVGLPELVACSVEDYERLALELASDIDRLSAIRTKLSADLNETALFDSQRFTRAIEKAYQLAYDRHLNGLSPENIYVPGDDYARGSIP